MIVLRSMMVVKLGGSVLTNKRAALSRKGTRPRFMATTARRLLREIRDSHREVVLVTGAGSFGHVLADRYALKLGYKEDRQWDGYVTVSRDVRRLNLLILDEAVRLGMRVISIPPSVSVLQCDGKIHYLDEGVFRRYVAQGIAPLSFGDVALDMGDRKFSICGGDDLVVHLSQLFGAERAVFVSDVDGIRVGERGALAPEFTRADLERITPMKDSRLNSALPAGSAFVPGPGLRASSRKAAGSSRMKGAQGHDVTGGIAAKARLALELAASGTEVVILNGRKRGRLLDALKGGRPRGTWFRRPPA